MAENPEHLTNQSYNSVYERLVGEQPEILNQVAYCIYKQIKKEYIIRRKKELGITIGSLPDNELEPFVNLQTDKQLDFYRREATDILFYTLDEFHKELIEQKEKQLEDKFSQEYKVLALKFEKPKWLTGFLQSLVASFAFAGTLAFVTFCFVFGNGGLRALGEFFINASSR